jgi:hypothetical protein
VFVCEIKVPAINGKALLSHTGYGLSPYDDGNGNITAYERLRAIDQSEKVKIRGGFVYYGSGLRFRRKIMKKEGETFILSEEIDVRNRIGRWVVFEDVDWHYH